MKFVWRSIILVVLFGFGCSQDLTQFEGEKLLDINETQLFVKVIGNGEPIVILHGGPGLDHTYFLPQMETLAEKYKLIFFDQRLSGRSSADVDSSDITLQHFINDIEGIRKAFKLEKMNLLGHSWGGVLAMKYAIQYSQNLKSLILVNTNPASSNFLYQANEIVNLRLIRQNRDAEVDSLGKEAVRQGTAEAFENYFRLLFSANIYSKGAVDSLILSFPDDFVARGEKLRYLYKDAGKYDFNEELPSITAPTLIIRGAYDSLPKFVVQLIHDNIPNSKLEVIDNCGHFPFVEKTDVFNKLIDEFMTSLQNGG